MLSLKSTGVISNNLKFEEEYNYIVGLTHSMELYISSTIKSLCKKNRQKYVCIQLGDELWEIEMVLESEQFRDAVVIFDSSSIIITKGIMYLLKNTKAQR